jgi:hypothetical protein
VRFSACGVSYVVGGAWMFSTGLETLGAGVLSRGLLALLGGLVVAGFGLAICR